jgi:hypothetical protein
MKKKMLSYEVSFVRYWIGLDSWLPFSEYPNHLLLMKELLSQEIPRYHDQGPFDIVKF